MRKTRVSRGPGRPRKIDKRKLDGIVDQPQVNNNNIVEMISYDPLYFKELFNYFKNLNVQEICIRWTATSIVIFTINSIDEHRLCISIPPEHLGRYYYAAEEPEIFTIVPIPLLKNPLGLITKNFKEIVLHFDAAELGKYIAISFTSDLADATTTYKVALINKELSAEIFNIENFIKPAEVLQSEAFLSFTLSNTKFKKSISDVYAGNNNITISKLQDRNLCFEYKYNNQLLYTEEFKNAENIELCIGANVDFIKDYSAQRLKNVINYMVAEKITTYCFEDYVLLVGRSEKKLFTTYALVINKITG